MDYEKLVLEKYKNLIEIRNKYRVLNHNTKYRFDYREMAIDMEIECLEDIMNGISSCKNWESCYKEDFLESGNK